MQTEAERLGFDRVAFVPAGPTRDAARLREWLAADRQGTMEWMNRSEEKRTDPRLLLPGARTIVALLTFYYTEPTADSRQWVGRVSRYAWGSDYHNVLGRRLRKLARFLSEATPGARAVPAVDARPILEKEWAERAGLGWIGKHTNLIAHDRGSWFFLSELITDVDLGAQEEPAKERCGTCTACLDACPTGAIVGPWEVDARRCISYLTIEYKGSIPVEHRPAIGEWIFGCDICQDVCPWNRFAVPVEEPRFQLDRGRFEGDLTTFLPITGEEFLRRFEGSPVRRAGRDAFVRNVCVALGNRRDPDTAAALAAALADEAPLVRGHAAWALGRIGGETARAALRARLERESDSEAAAEIRSALLGA